MTGLAAAQRKQVAPPRKHNRPDLFLYGALALPLAFAGLPVYLHAPDFYATTYGLSLAALGAVLLGLRVVDAVQDPLIGAFSDAFAHRRKLILLAGAFLLLAGFAGLFNPPALSGTGHLAWFAVNVFVCTTGFSIMSINYQALGALWPASSPDRTRITGTREALGLVGILAASVLPSVLRNRYDAAAAFQVVTLVLAVLLVVGGLLFLRWYARHSGTAAKAPVWPPPPAVFGICCATDGRGGFMASISSAILPVPSPPSLCCFIFATGSRRKHGPGFSCWFIF